jgi:hypothetical protein
MGNFKNIDVVIAPLVRKQRQKGRTIPAKRREENPEKVMVGSILPVF